MNISREQLILYAVTDRSWLNGRTLYEQVEEALEGGTTLVQLREKNMPDKDFINEAVPIMELCHRYNVPLIINDRVNVAAEIHADGVHIGQSDMDAAKARKILGPDSIIGVTAKTVEQALKAQAAGADYLGSGAVFGTTTKSDAKPMDIDTLNAICDSVDIPVVAIGGINNDNVMKLSGSRIAGIAVVSGIFDNKDIKGAAQSLRAKALNIISGR